MPASCQTNFSSSSLSHIPRSALKAGSTLPPLARKTAFMTVASILGKASFSVFSACCVGLAGRGGLGGATSSAEPEGSILVAGSCFGVGTRGCGEAGVS